MASSPPITAPTTPSLSTYGAYTKDALLKDVKSGALSVQKLAKDNPTTFTWAADSAQNYMTRGNVLPFTSPPPTNDRQPIRWNTAPAPFSYSTPVQLKEAVKTLTAQPHDSPNMVETLDPATKRAYLERRSALDKKPFISKVASVTANMVDAAVSPIGGGIEKAVSVAKKSKTVAEQESLIEQKINALYSQAESLSEDGLATGKAASLYAQARQLHDSYMAMRVRNMSDEEIMRFDTEHPIVHDVTKGLAVGGMQFVALRNAPFLNQLGNALEQRAAAGLAGTVAARTSRYTASLTKLAAQAAGDLPTNFLLPVLNFDYERRPLSDLPKQVTLDLALLIPTTLLVHAGSSLVGAAASKVGAKLGIGATKIDGPDMAALIAKYGDADSIPLNELSPQGMADAASMTSMIAHGSSAQEAAHSLSQQAPVIKAAAKVAAMARALRIPLRKGSHEALEGAAMHEVDNAFARILSALPDDARILRDHFQQQRISLEAENRLLHLDSADRSISIGENRPAGRLGPKPDPLVPKVPRSLSPREQEIIGSAGKPEIQPVELEMMTRTAREPMRKQSTVDAMMSDLEAKKTWDSLATEMRAFRDGLRQGKASSKQGIKELQTQLTDFIKEKLPPKYRGRALPLIKRALDFNGMASAMEGLEKIVRGVELSELKIGTTQGGIKRGVKAAVKDLLINPPPDIQLEQPYQRSLWFKNLLQFPFGKEKTAGALKVAEEALTKASTEAYSSLTPIKGLQRTWAAVKQYPKQVQSELAAAVDDLNYFFNRNFVDRAQVAEFEKYRTLRMMADRAKQGFTNPGVPELGIPNNPTAGWIESTLRSMDSPELQKINSEFNDLYVKNTLEQYRGRVDEATINEWKTKYPDHMTFFYKKYAGENGGIPNKGYNFSAREYLQSIRGGEGLEISPNLYDTTIRSFSRAISDKFTDVIASTLRQEMGLQPLKIIEDAGGGRLYQAIIDGKFHQFDAQDLEAGIVKGLENQRVLFSKVDKQAFLVPKAIADVVRNERAKRPAILNALSTVTHAWQDLTTTYRPSFALASNPIKDLEFAIINTDHGVRDFLSSYLSSARDLMAGMLANGDRSIELRLKDGSFAIDESVFGKLSQKFKETRTWMANRIGTEGWEKFNNEFVESGAGQGGYITGRTGLRETDETLLGSISHMISGKELEYSVSAAGTKFIKNPLLRNIAIAKNGLMALTFDTVGDMGSFLEKIPRAAEFRLSRAVGESLQAAGAAASDITLDFHEQGSSQFIAWIKAIYPYQFTAFRGNVKLVKAAVGKGRGPMAAAIIGRRIVGTTIVPAVASWLINKQLGIWDRTDKTLQRNYWIVPTGRTWKDQYGNVNPVVFTPRMGELSQRVAPMVYAMLDHFFEKDPSAFSSITPTGLQNVLLSGLTPLFRLPIEITTNYSFFRQQPIDPQYMQDLPPELRNYKGTTPVGNWIGNALGVGGNRGDYLFNGAMPAIFEGYKSLTKDTEDKPLWLSTAQALKILQIPSTFFSDKDMDKKRKSILDMVKQAARQFNATPEQREKATQRLWKEMDELNTMIDFQAKQRAAHPLQGEEILPETGINKEKIRAFFLAKPEERRTMLQQMSPAEVEEIKRVSKPTQ